MMIETYIIHAFTNEVFRGNPAAVCLLNDWPDDSQMQAIAKENNLSETAFVVPEDNDYRIRWFTPSTEVELCGHATLASAHVLFNIKNIADDGVTFHSLSGPLYVKRTNEKIQMDFPAQNLKPVQLEDVVENATGVRPGQVLQSDIFSLAVFDSEKTIKAMSPDFKTITNVDKHALIVTAPGNNVDFVSRVFAPNVGIDEDPVTGSAHCALTPYWSQRLNKASLSAKQISTRGGNLECELNGDRVLIRGQATLYMSGAIEVPGE